MTWMPRSQPLHASTPGSPFVGHGLVRTVFTQWHALCGVLLCTGCLYIGPVTLLVDENVPPEIYASSTDTPCQEQYPELVNPLCVYERGTGEGTKVFVSATDDNDDVLDFIWWGTMSGFFDDDVPSTASWSCSRMRSSTGSISTAM